MAESINSPREHFLSNISVWELDVPLQTQWVVRIAPKIGLFDFFSEISRYASVDHSQLRESVKYSHYENFLGPRTNALEEGLGLYFAQSVELPGESLDMETISMPGDNCFVQSSVIKNRSSGSKREISMKLLETNVDIVDGLIRPWIIACGYRGNVEIPGAPSLKADIQIVQYTKGENKPIRKIHNFIDCTPYSTQGSNLQYDSESIVAKDVSWIYNYYHYKLI
jgi:hypothetical protein